MSIYLGTCQLLKHYEINFFEHDNPFLELSLKMAERHVPGFKVQDGIKRKETKWAPIKLAQLYLDVEKRSEEKPGLSKYSLCSLMHRSESSSWNQERSSKSLYNRYTESQNSVLVTLLGLTH